MAHGTICVLVATAKQTRATVSMAGEESLSVTTGEANACRHRQSHGGTYALAIDPVRKSVVL